MKLNIILYLNVKNMVICVLRDVCFTGENLKILPLKVILYVCVCVCAHKHIYYFSFYKNYFV